jgi:ParB/RepB/Spo0J family partition protein
MTTAAAFEYIRQTADRTKVGNVWELRIDGKLVAVENADGALAVELDALEGISEMTDRTPEDLSEGDNGDMDGATQLTGDGLDALDGVVDPPAKPNRRGRNANTGNKSNHGANVRTREPRVTPAPKPGAKPAKDAPVSKQSQIKADAKARDAAAKKEAADKKKADAEAARIERDRAKQEKKDAADAKRAEAAIRKQARADAAAEKAAAKAAKEAPIDMTGIVPESKSGPTITRVIPLDSITEFSPGDPPSREFVESIRRAGVTVPVVVRENEDGTYTLIDGRRRVVAALMAGLTTVTAAIEERADVDDDIMALALNAQRSGNLLDQHRHVKALLSKGMTIAQIVASPANMTEHEVLRANKIGDLLPEFQAMIEYGQLLPAAAYRTAQMSPKEQKALLKVAERNGGKLSARDVSAVRRMRQSDAVKKQADAITGELPALPLPDAVTAAKLDTEATDRVAAATGDANAPRMHRKATALAFVQQAEALMESLTNRDDDEDDALMLLGEVIKRFTPAE